MNALHELVRRGHLKTCGSNRVTDCDEDCRDLRDEAATVLAALERVAEMASELLNAMDESAVDHRDILTPLHRLRREHTALEELK